MTLDEENALRQQLAECNAIADAKDRMIEELSRNACQLEPVSNTYKLGQCIKCGNPAQDQTQEHIVVATASEGVSPPEDSNPQRVEAPQDMVGRIADILVEDHVALMNELATVTAERDALSKAYDVLSKTYDALAKLGADKTGEKL